MSTHGQRLMLSSEVPVDAAQTLNYKSTTDLNRPDVSAGIVNRQEPRASQVMGKKLFSVTGSEAQVEKLNLSDQPETPKLVADVEMNSQQTRNKLTATNIPDASQQPVSVAQTAPSLTGIRMSSDSDVSSEEESLVVERKERKKKICKTKKKKVTTTSSIEMSSQESLIEKKKSLKAAVGKKLTRPLTKKAKKTRSKNNSKISSNWSTDLTKTDSNELLLSSVTPVDDLTGISDVENIPPPSCNGEKEDTTKRVKGKVSLNSNKSVTFQDDVEVCETDDDDGDWLNRLDQKKGKFDVRKNDTTFKMISAKVNRIEVPPPVKVPAKARVVVGKKKTEAAPKATNLAKSEQKKSARLML